MIKKENFKIKDLQQIDVNSFHDFRGEYVETFNIETYQFTDSSNEIIKFKEDDFSVSKKYVLRGLHGDNKTWKLVQCIFGEIYLVVVDFRSDSPTFKFWQSFSLSDKKRTQILIPPGCLNGTLCMSETSIFTYKQSEIYTGNSENQFTVRWDDPQLNIYWPIRQPILSQRDASAIFL